MLNITHIHNYFAKKSGLTSDQFGFFLDTNTENATANLIATKNNQLVNLGQLSYKGFMKAKFNISAQKTAVIEAFLDLCAKKLKDPEIQVPTLYNDPELWDSHYKTAAMNARSLCSPQS